jgi:autotransporter-associated beta strand protein
MSLSRHFFCLAASTLMVNAGVNYYYLDLNGSTPGFGTLGGFWNDTDQIWSTSAAGDITTVSRVFSSGRNYYSATGWDYDVAVFGANGGTGGVFTIVDGKTIEVNGLIDNVGMSFNALGSGTLNLKGEPGRGLKVAAGVTSQFAMPIVINTGANADFEIIGNCTISGALSGSGFDKAGVGTLILTGTNTNTGVTQITAGILRLVGSGAVSSASEYFVSGVDGTLELDSGVSINTVRGYSDGFASRGAVVARSGSNSIQTVAMYTLMGGDLSGMKVVADAGATLSIGTVTGSGAFHVGGAGDVLITSNTSLYELHKIGSGTLTIPAGVQVIWSGGAIIMDGTLSAQAS